MLRLSVLTLALAAAASATPAAPVPKDAGKPVLYFPTTVGAKWVYDWGTGDRIEQVTAVEDRDGKTVVTLGVLVGEKVTPYCKVLVSGRGLFFGTGGLAEAMFPHPLLKLPAKAGDRWEWEAAPGRKAARAVVGEEDLEVPAGKFRAVRVESEVPVGKEGTQKTTLWYAPGVGWVKMVSRFGDAEETKVLKSFAPGKH